MEIPLSRETLDSWFTPKVNLTEKEEENICEFCNGEGEVRSMEYVYPGEPHMADIGTKKCICQREEDEYDPDREI